jgi:hypothetical protein
VSKSTLYTVSWAPHFYGQYELEDADWFEEESMEWGNSYNLAPSFFLSLFKLCPRLQDLLLVNVFLHTAPPIFAFPALPSLFTLRIRSVRDDISDGFVTLILACFSRVDSIDIGLENANFHHENDPALNEPLQLTVQRVCVGLMLDEHDKSTGS